MTADEGERDGPVTGASDARRKLTGVQLLVTWVLTTLGFWVTMTNVEVIFPLGDPIDLVQGAIKAAIFGTVMTVALRLVVGRSRQQGRRYHYASTWAVVGGWALAVTVCMIVAADPVVSPLMTLLAWAIAVVLGVIARRHAQSDQRRDADRGERR